MRRPPIKALLVIGLVAASSPMFFRSRSGTPPTPAISKKTARATPFHGKVDAAMAIRQPSNAVAATQSKIQTTASPLAHPSPAISHTPDAAQIAISPAANATIPAPDRAASPSPSRPEAAAFGNQSPLPAIQLADDVRLPAALMPHDTANESPEIAAARAAIGDRFYRALQENAAQETATNLATEPPASKNPATEPTTGTDATVIIHPSPASENALKHANEEYRALFGDAAFNQKTIDTHLEVKLPTSEDTPPTESSH